MEEPFQYWSSTFFKWLLLIIYWRKWFVSNSSCQKMKQSDSKSLFDWIYCHRNVYWQFFENFCQTSRTQSFIDGLEKLTYMLKNTAFKGNMNRVIQLSQPVHLNLIIKLLLLQLESRILRQCMVMTVLQYKTNQILRRSATSQGVGKNTQESDNFETWMKQIEKESN